MNTITIEGGNASQKDKVFSLTQFCIKKLMPRMRSLDINIKLTRLGKEANGYCLRQTDREFELEIDSRLTLRTMLETVAHEMVHVKQYARREMNDFAFKEVHYKWKGKLVPESTDYWDLPWEIEANGREVGLFIRWCEQAGYGDKAWANI
jgi:hypothetical protein|tara:strand:- start:296 stop:745 length:450 start_codon:yes stop_codon:yes gene_type:complete